MRLVTYTLRGCTRLGAMTSDTEVVDLSRAAAVALTGDGRSERDALNAAERSLPSEMLAFLALGEDGSAAAIEALAFATELAGRDRAFARDIGVLFDTAEPGFRLEAPVPRPRTVLAIGLNYREHAAEANREPTEQPIVFSKASSCIIGPGAPILRPSISERVDWEGELCVVIGRHAYRVSQRDAHRYIAGYMIGNDVSVRDWQRHTPQWMMGKSFLSHGPTGPCLVTADQVANPEDLDLRTWVNGVLKQESNTSRFIFSIGRLIEYITTAFPLEPGDVIFTGTPAGIGAARRPQEFLKAGDVVRVEISGLGVLENPVVDQAADAKIATTFGSRSSHAPAR